MAREYWAPGPGRAHGSGASESVVWLNGDPQSQATASNSG